MLPVRNEHGSCYATNECNKCTQKMWCELYPHNLGVNYYMLGIGYRVYTMRGWVTLDTLAEVREEFNEIESMYPPSPKFPQLLLPQLSMDAIYDS